MKSLNIFPIAARLLVLVSVANALILEKRHSDDVFKIPLHKRTNEVHAQSLRNRLVKRSGVVEVLDTNYMTTLLYVLQLSIGTPPQDTMVQLDTGSSDLVVETPSSNICSAPAPNPCTNFGACKKSLFSGCSQRHS
jgi:hypothetical protein